MKVIPLPHTTESITIAAETLSRAFFSDPLWVFVFPEPRKRKRNLSTIFRFMLRYGCRYGNVVLDEAASAVAIWFPSSHAQPNLFTALILGAISLPLKLHFNALSLLIKIERIQNRIRRRLVPHPHYYLSLLGVAPEKQKTGIGSLLVHQVLTNIASFRLPVYLETVNKNNLRFYQRLGFKELQRTPLAGLPLTLYSLIYQF